MPVLERALNACLAEDPAALARCTALAGRSIALVIRGPGLCFYLTAIPNGVIVSAVAPEQVEATVEASPLALMRLGLGQVPASDLMLSREMSITGDTTLGQAFRDLFLGLRLDWEEILSRYTGDVLAHQIGNLVRGGSHWVAGVQRTLEMNTAEYLQEESRLVVSGEALAGFARAVDEARMAVDRLEARLHRLQTAGRAGRQSS